MSHDLRDLLVYEMPNTGQRLDIVVWQRLQDVEFRRLGAVLVRHPTEQHLHR